MPEFELGTPTPVLDLHNNQASHLSLLMSTTQCTLHFESHVKEYKKSKALVLST